MCVCVALVCMLVCTTLCVRVRRHMFRCVCARAWGSVFEECACVEMRDSITIATQSEQRSSGHTKHRNNERTIDHLLDFA